MPEAAWAKRLMARTLDRRTAGLHVRAALVSQITHLGAPTTRRAAEVERIARGPALSVADEGLAEAARRAIGMQVGAGATE